jgi:ferritin-like metal-binding protein YciE
LLGENEAVSILDKTLTEEKETDKALTALAENINVEAMDVEASKKESLPAKIMKKVAGN